MRVLNTYGRTLALLASLFLTNSISQVHAVENVTSSSHSDNGLTLAINVPNEPNATDLYFSFTAPASSHSWAAFGIGSGMADSLIFVVYKSDTNGGAPTVSPRLGTGLVQPQHTDSVNVTVMSGSLVNDTAYVANFHCSGCRSWNNGNLNVQDTSAGFFFGTGPSSPDVISKDLNAAISRHSVTPTTFQMNVAAALGAGGVPNSNGTSTTDDDSDGYTYITVTVLIHMLGMIGAFLVVFPGGYLLLRLLERVWIHWGLQTFGVLCVLIGFATGLTASIKEGHNPKLTDPHQIIGLIVVALVLSTYGVGLAGHLRFKRTGTKSAIMLGHRVLGPGSIALGLINGCVGFNFAGKPRSIIGFAVLSFGMIIFVTCLVMLKKKAKLRKQAMNSTAAMNFREGYGGAPQYNQYEHGPPEYYAPHGAAVPMQTFPPSQNREHGYVDQINVQPK